MRKRINIAWLVIEPLQSNILAATSQQEERHWSKTSDYGFGGSGARKCKCWRLR